jgi:hypothetical protein
MLKYIKYIFMLTLFVIVASCNSENELREIPNIKHDTDVLQESSKLDVLLVLDNSCSMLEDWSFISYGLTKVPQELDDKSIDWKLSLISMDPTDGLFLELDSSLPDLGWEIISLIDLLRTNAGGLEEGFSSALTAKTIHGDWFRTEAQTLIIFVSDESEQSNISAQDFQNLWGSTFIAASIVGPRELSPQVTSCADAAESYHLVSQIIIDICITEPWSIIEQLP